MTFFDEHGEKISGPEWVQKYKAYYFLGGPTWKGVNRRNQSSPFIEDLVCSLLDRPGPLLQSDLILLMAWKMGLIDHSSSDVLRKVTYKHNFDTTLISHGQFGALNFSKSIPYLAANMPAIVQSLNQRPEYLVDWVRGPHPELEGFGITYILTVQFFLTHGKGPIYDKFAHMAAVAIHQGLHPGSQIKWQQIQDWSGYQHYVNLLKPISAACSQAGSSSLMSVPRPVDRALWVYGHFFEGQKPMQNKQTLSNSVNRPASEGAVSCRTELVRCSVDSMSQKYADGRTRVVLSVRPESTNAAPTLRISDGRIPITLSTPVGDFEAGIRAWSSTSDRPYVCPDLRSRCTHQKEALARVLESCGISLGSIIDVAISGDTWRIIGGP